MNDLPEKIPLSPCQRAGPHGTYRYSGSHYCADSNPGDSFLKVERESHPSLEDAWYLEILDQPGAL